MIKRRFSNYIIGLLFISLIGCSQSHRFYNNSLSAEQLSMTVSEEVELYSNNDEVAVILTFSGGGTRAAAFSYGVMKGLRDTKTNVGGFNDMSLLEYVDVISSVSGGSFTSAYYGLFGDRLFKDFESDFLDSNIQGQLTRRLLLSPFNWIRFMSGNYSRSDLTANHYQKYIFENKTFADMRADAPTIMINATDIASGAVFTFSEDHFRWLCSDLSSYPVGRAVTASSAVPVLFSPVILKNRTGCQPFDYQLSTISQEERYMQNSLKLRGFNDKTSTPFIHLVDGGVADNLGVRSLLNQIYQQDNNFWNALKAYNLTKTKKILFVIVNAAATLNKEVYLSIKSPNVSKTISAVTSIQSQNYNADTLDLLDSSVPIWIQQVKEGRCSEHPVPECDEFKFVVTELNFSQLEEPTSSLLAAIETALQLPPSQVDLLIEAGYHLVMNSSIIQDFAYELALVE